MESKQSVSLERKINRDNFAGILSDLNNFKQPILSDKLNKINDAILHCSQKSELFKTLEQLEKFELEIQEGKRCLKKLEDCSDIEIPDNHYHKRLADMFNDVVSEAECCKQKLSDELDGEINELQKIVLGLDDDVCQSLFDVKTCKEKKWEWYLSSSLLSRS